MEEIKEEYVKPQISTYYVDADELLDFRISNREGDGGPLAKPGDDEWEEDESITNKWDNLVPSGVPESWQPVGE